jgi:hypothetical protein
VLDDGCGQRRIVGGWGRLGELRRVVVMLFLEAIRRRIVAILEEQSGV